MNNRDVRLVKFEFIIGVVDLKASYRDFVNAHGGHAAVFFGERARKNIAVTQARIGVACHRGSRVRYFRRLEAVSVLHVARSNRHGTFADGEHRRFVSNVVVGGNDCRRSVAQRISSYAGG